MSVTIAKNAGFCFGVKRATDCVSALLTDALRADLLELCGYKTQVLEFIDLTHTPKNILIRAIKRPPTPRSTVERCRREIDSALKEFQVEPTLYRLLRDDERI